ncbi:MAG: ABC transporter ATP-binding protein [Myxococcales bacterium]|nr:ABC transporter ATP-binding protein [Myxococcales bacterium]
MTTRDQDAPLVVIEGASKTYEHEGKLLTVLEGVDIAIDRGEMVSIVGPSGAGKSTLLHLIGTLDMPTRGRVVIDGEEVTKLKAARVAELRNRTIGFVFQFHHLLPEFSALENVVMPGMIQGIANRAALETRGRALLDEVGLGHRVSHRPGELSGGEQQRVALARALMLQPQLLLADEPTGNLDSANSQQIHALFHELNQRHRTTMVIVTHNPELARSIKRVVSMRDGRIESDSKNDG